jgi:hypothetical protein
MFGLMRRPGAAAVALGMKQLDANPSTAMAKTAADRSPRHGRSG